jgi:hypothetical protein
LVCAYVAVSLFPLKIKSSELEQEKAQKVMVLKLPAVPINPDISGQGMHSLFQFNSYCNLDLKKAVFIQGHSAIPPPTS